MRNPAMPTLLAAVGLVGVAAAISPHFVVHAGRQQPSATSDQVRSVWDGVYTVDQAKLGESAYLAECTGCHGESLVGAEGGPPLVGDSFLEEWERKNAADLFEKIFTSMPADNPGRLSRQQAADILAFIFQRNNFPPGNNSLDRDTAALRMIKIAARRTGLN